MSKEGVFHLDVALTGVPENGKMSSVAFVWKYDWILDIEQ